MFYIVEWEFADRPGEIYVDHQVDTRSISEFAAYVKRDLVSRRNTSVCVTVKDARGAYAPAGTVTMVCL